MNQSEAKPRHVY